VFPPAKPAKPLILSLHCRQGWLVWLTHLSGQTAYNCEILCVQILILNARREKERGTTKPPLGRV
jgi:hypothetical protein